MSSRVLRRRSATAAWIYAAVACGIAGSIVAARVFGLDDFGVFMTALVVVGFFQSLLDLTVEESLTKYGFRYVTGKDWGRLRRLFRQAVLLKVVGGMVATLLIVAMAPFADEIFDADGLGQALLAARSSRSSSRPRTSGRPHSSFTAATTCGACTRRDRPRSASSRS